MNQFKIGPKEVVTLWQGVRFHASRYFKLCGIGFAFILMASIPGLLFRYLSHREPSATDIDLLQLSFVLFTLVAFGFAGLILYMAKREAFSWFKVTTDGLVLFRISAGEELVSEVIRFKQIQLFLFSQGSFLYPETIRDQCYLVSIRYRPDSPRFGLDAIASLGYRPKQETEELLALFRSKHSDIKTLSEWDPMKSWK